MAAAVGDGDGGSGERWRWRWQQRWKMLMTVGMLVAMVATLGGDDIIVG